MDHKSYVFWFTGLSGSGKTTLAMNAETKLYQLGFRCKVLDGDCLRAGLNSDLGFTEEDRRENLRRASEVAAMFLDAGFLVLVPMISPDTMMRERIKERFQADQFAEIFVQCSLEACEERDPKGLYRKARNGEISEFTGIDSKYEAPLRPDLTIDTEHYSEDECVNSLINFIKERMT